MRLFAGTYTRSGGEGILTFEFDGETGALTRLSASDELVNPSYLTLSSDKKMLYAVGEQGGSTVVGAFQITDGGLSFLNKAEFPGHGACHISISPDGRFAAVACYSSGDVLTVGINKDGSVGGLVTQVTYMGRGPVSVRQDTPHAHCAVFTPCGHYIVTADLGIDSIYRHTFDAETGGLGAPVRVLRLPGGEGPRHIVFEPERKWMLVNSELGNKLFICAVNPETGELTLIKNLPLLEPGLMTAGISSALKLSPDNSYVIAGNRAEGNEPDELSNSVSVFDLREDAGMRRTVSHTGGKTPRDFALSPDGKFLIAAHQDSGSLVVHRFDEGKLCGAVCQVEAVSAVCVAFG